MKKNGAQMLSEIDRKVGETRTHVQDLSGHISETQNKIDTLEQEETKLYSKLAALRLGVLNDTPMQNEITDTENGVRAILKERQDARDALDKKLQANQADQNALEQERVTAAKSLESLANKIKSKEQKVLDGLAKEVAYQTHEANIQTLEIQIARTEHKIKTAQDDYNEKTQPYKNDPLFMYLWDRGYNTSTYRASSLIRVLDRWVARLSAYNPARRNFAMLSGIPEKLMQHKEILEERMENLERDQDSLEKSAFEKAGVLKLQNSYAEKHDALEDIDTRLGIFESGHQEILDKKAEYLDKADPLYEKAVTVLGDIYKSDTPENLRREALLTATSDDDNLVRRLLAIDAEMDEQKVHLDSYVSALNVAQHELSQAQQVRTTFKNKGYASHQTKFSDNNMFQIFLGQFITGVLTNSDFWEFVGQICVEVMGSNSRGYRSRGQRRPSRQSRTSFPRSRPAPSRSSGGFRTGGGF